MKHLLAEETHFTESTTEQKSCRSLLAVPYLWERASVTPSDRVVCQATLCLPAAHLV